MVNHCGILSTPHYIKDNSVGVFDYLGHHSIAAIYVELCELGNIIRRESSFLGHLLYSLGRKRGSGLNRKGFKKGRNV
jgi:hypothetical protein